MEQEELALENTEDFEDELLWDNSGEPDSRPNSPLRDENHLLEFTEKANSQTASPHSVESNGPNGNELYDDKAETYDIHTEKPDCDIKPMGSSLKDTNLEKKAISPIRWDDEEAFHAIDRRENEKNESKQVILEQPEKCMHSVDEPVKLLDLWRPLFKDARYFLIKSNNHENIEIARERCLWSSTKSNEARINKAFFEFTNVILVFSIKESGKFQGFARVSSPSDPRVKVNWVLPARMSSDLLSSPFKLDWISKKELPFTRTMNITNSWNENKPVKIGRDGQEIEFRSGEALCSLFPFDETCDVATIIAHIRPDGKRERRREERRNVALRINTDGLRMNSRQGLPKLPGVQPAGGTGLLGSVGAIGNLRNQFGDRRAVFNQNAFGAGVPPPLMQVNAAAAAMAAASALAAMSTSGQSTLVNAIARNTSGGRAFPGMAEMRQQNITPLMSNFSSGCRGLGASGLLNTPNFTGNNNASLVGFMQPNVGLNSSNPAAVFARALQHMGGVNAGSVLRGGALSFPSSTTNSVLQGVGSSQSGDASASLNPRRYRSPDSEGSYGSPDPLPGRHARDNNYYPVENSNSRPYGVCRAASPQRNLETNYRRGAERRQNRSRSRSSIPVDPDTLMAWDYDQYVQQASRVAPPNYPSSCNDLPRAPVGRQANESDLVYEERVNAFLRGIRSNRRASRSYSRSRSRSRSYSRSRSRSRSYSYTPPRTVVNSSRIVVRGAPPIPVRSQRVYSRDDYESDSSGSVSSKSSQEQWNVRGGDVHRGGRGLAYDRGHAMGVGGRSRILPISRRSPTPPRVSRRPSPRVRTNELDNRRGRLGDSSNRRRSRPASPNRGQGTSNRRRK